MQKVASQDDRECVARLVGMNAPLALRTIDVSPVKQNAKQIKSYLRKRYRKLKFALPMPEAKRLMRERQSKMILEAKLLTDDEPKTAKRPMRLKKK